MFLKILIFKILYFLKLGLIFVGSVHNFGRSDDRRPVVPGCAGCAMAHPDFGRSVNPISTRGDRLCPPNYYWHTRIFRPSDGPGLPTGETGTTADAHKFSETLTLSPTVGAEIAHHCRSQINFPVVMFLPI